MTSLNQKTLLGRVIVVGGGFYGCSLAIEMAKNGYKVTLLEKEESLLGKASYNNQARVHGGYHYPRSFMTGVRSRYNFDRFTREYKNAIENRFTKLYAIAKSSKVTAKQFFEFCERMKSPIKIADPKLQGLFSKDQVESVFEVQEYAFNAIELKKIVTAEMESVGVTILLSTCANSLKKENGKIIVNGVTGKGEAFTQEGDEVFIATYSRLNEILCNSNLPLIPLRHELTEMSLIEVPPLLSEVGITVMDGPFWSLMPFPPKKLMTLSHVRYTPHYQWSEDSEYVNVEKLMLQKESNFLKMMKDAARFVPSISEVTYKDSLWEVKTIMPRSDGNDSRPILFKKDYGIPGLNLVLGGKIDNIFDIIDKINEG